MTNVWSVRVEIVILHHRNKPIANLTISQFNSLFDEEQSTELFSAPDDSDIKIGTYNLDLEGIHSKTCD